MSALEGSQMAVACSVLFVHWVADFCLQTDRMAKEKSHSWEALGEHIGVYTVALALLAGLAGWPLSWVMWNGGAHFIIDAASSRATSWLYTRSRHWFFVCIGFDQWLHTVTLLGTLVWLT